MLLQMKMMLVNVETFCYTIPALLDVAFLLKLFLTKFTVFQKKL